MKRVLIIAYYWPPSGGSGVQRWVKFVKYLRDEGWEPVVFAPENPEYPAVDLTMGDDLPKDLEVIKRPILEPYGIYRKLMGQGASTDMKTLTSGSGKDTQAGSTQAGSDQTARADGGAVTEISSGKKSFKQWLSLWIRGNVFVPDPRVGWVGPSVRYLKKYLREHPVEAIVTTGPPHSVHLIGLKIHRATGLPWIPDFRDPWTRMYYLKHLPLTACTWRKLCKQEQTVLDECSTVLAVTPLVQEEFRAQTGTPVACITNGFDEEDFTGPVPQVDTHFNITHTGLFAADGNPLVLWKILGEMARKDERFRQEMRLRLVGKTDREILDAIDAEGLSGNVVALGYCDHATAVREQRAATVLILPLRQDPEYRPILPGKLFEYLAARRPVLGIGQEDGAMARVLEQTRAGVTADWDNEAAVRAFLTRAWEQWQGGGVPATQGDISPYTRRAITHALAGLLDQVRVKE